jgi:hypothetical protein
LHPDHCRKTDDGEQCGLTSEIKNGRLRFRLTVPYSEQRKKTESGLGKAYQRNLV